MDSPLIVVEGHDLGLFTSEEALTLKLEPHDVRAGVYDVFDSYGRVIELDVEKGEVEHVIVKSVEAEPGHKGELRSALVDGLVAGFGEASEPLEQLSLRELIELAVKRFGFDD